MYPMEIQIERWGKKYSSQWIFHNLDYHFKFPKSYAIIGPNGSGKSTLIQSIAGFITPSRGKLTYLNKDRNPILPEDYYQYLAFSAPYMELIEELTLREHLNFHFKFKNLNSHISFTHIAGIVGNELSSIKLIKQFSSGMKQRLRLSLAFYAETPLLFLDEPTANLDEQGMHWYREEIAKQKDKRLIIVASNQKQEYLFCDDFVKMVDYK